MRTYTPSSNDTASLEVLQLARYWIRRCNGHQHPECRDWDLIVHSGKRSDRFFPRRLLKLPEPKVSRDTKGLKNEEEEDAKGSRKPKIPIHDVLEWDVNPQVKLIETGPKFAEENPATLYATLSHCWGSVKFRRLLMKNYRQCLEGIPLDSLPQTFRDAIKLLYDLERGRIKYIWIDSLCIIQDDADDWLTESVDMFRIYSNSYLNISATAATDSSKGLFFPRDPHNLWGDEINLNCGGLLRQDHSQNRSKLPLGFQPVIRRCDIFDLSFWRRQVEDSPVNRRAWVLQERLLAPRVLHFCQDQIAWECPELDAAEAYPHGVPTFELRSGSMAERVRLQSLLAYSHDPGEEVIMDIQHTSDIIHDHWKLVVERYATTSLTKPYDKLIAVAGIAQLMSSRIRGKYIAGMWEKYLASQLLWRVETSYENGRLNYPSKRSPVYRAPSFSWAAVDAPHGIRCAQTTAEKDLFLSIIGHHVQTTTESAFGPVKDDCFIDIECSMIPVKVEMHDHRGNVRYPLWTPSEGSTTSARSPWSLVKLSDDSYLQVPGNGNAAQEINRESPTTDANHDAPAVQPAFNVRHMKGFSPAFDRVDSVMQGAEDLRNTEHTVASSPQSSNPQTPAIVNDASTQQTTGENSSGKAEELRGSGIQATYQVKSTPAIVALYLDSPDDDFDELEKDGAGVYCVPAAMNSSDDLICLVLHRLSADRKEDKKIEVYRRVGLTTIPPFFEIKKTFMEHNENERKVIRIR